MDSFVEEVLLSHEQIVEICKRLENNLLKTTKTRTLYL